MAQYGAVSASVEGLDPLWSAGVSPMDVFQVAPSGTSQHIVVTVAAGGDFDQDILWSAARQECLRGLRRKTGARPRRFL